MKMKLLMMEVEVEVEVEVVHNKRRNVIAGGWTLGGLKEAGETGILLANISLSLSLPLSPVSLTLSSTTHRDLFRISDTSRHI